MRASELAARAAGTASRLTGRGGTSLPGKLLLRMEPRAIERLSRPLDSALLSATNGKTTTAAMAARILERGGRTLVHNRAGANMAGGVATALLRGRGDTGLFEVDEFWLPQVLPQVRPRALLLANLFRDQLDRYGELETIAERWGEALNATPIEQLVLNADDPVVADLGRDRQPLYFGVDDPGMAMAQMQHAADAKHCRRCGRAYVYDAIFMGHLGHYHCPNCGARRPQPAVTARAIELRGVRSARFELATPAGTAPVELPLPGLYNVYNALAAAALTLAMGAAIDDVVAGLQEVAPAFGRAETVQLGGRDLSILLVKNPAGANEVLRTLTLEPGEHDVLAVLNDNVADGRDVSWVWDADFEVLAGRVRRVTCSGTRAAEMAVRMKYAGVPVERIIVRDELDAGLDAAIGDGDGPLYALPTYTAMLALREELVRRGAARGSFM
ncbi:MAG TPA: MurT ligase domain-containing protein [Solirubrobacteraceae bacterium]|nr:MurT ligase domain-containing protein [Solirubrobacteraceae bacterium]